jgi:hypothetical protein
MPDHGEVGLSLWMKDKGHGNRVLRGKRKQITQQWDRAPRAHDAARLAINPYDARAADKVPVGRGPPARQAMPPWAEFRLTVVAGAGAGP